MSWLRRIGGEGLAVLALVAAMALCQSARAQTVRATEYLNTGGTRVPAQGITCINPTTHNPESCAGAGGGGGGGDASAANQTSQITLETAISNAVTAMSAKLPAALGPTTGANSVSVVPASDGFSVKMPSVTTGGATPYHFVSTASTNSTLVSTGAHTLYSLTITGLNTTAAYVRLYDQAAAPTCSSATGAAHSYPVIGSATAQGGLVVPIPNVGELYANGLGFCITGGGGDTDNTAAVAGVYVNATYK